ncbi:MAG: hypothetical protein II157_05655, partial [Bacteroidales bacterium]|nr:hypothetical protein [Bacteroidales bacterium]
WVLANDLLGTNDWAGCNKFMTKYDNTEATKLQMPCLWDFFLRYEAPGLTSDGRIGHICIVFK